MAVKSIVQLGDPRLRMICSRVENPANTETAAELKNLCDTLYDARARTGYGRAIAAPQIGVMKRLVVVCLPDCEPLFLVNAEIVTRSSETMIVWDGCLSFLFLFLQVTRHVHITVRYQNVLGETLSLEAGPEDDLSELLQHEIDHLNGILAIDRVSDLKSLCSREEFERRHRQNTPYAVT